MYFTKGFHWQLLSFFTLVLIGLWAYHFPKIGVEFMPPLNEGTVMDMPVSVPRVSVTEAADDLKARDALLRSFPEVESVIGKAGRADTPTDPAPLEMVETFVNFRPKELWPKRAMHFDDAARQTRAVLAKLEQQGYVQPAKADDRDDLDQRRGHERPRPLRRDDALAGRGALPGLRAGSRPGADALRRGGDGAPHSARTAICNGRLARTRKRRSMRWRTPWPRPTASGWRRTRSWRTLPSSRNAVAQALADRHVLKTEPAQALVVKENPVLAAVTAVGEAAGLGQKTFAGEVLKAVQEKRDALWAEFVDRKLNWELFDRGVEAFTWAALEEVGKSARGRGLLGDAPHGDDYARFLDQSAMAGDSLRKSPATRGGESPTMAPFVALRQELEKPFASGLLLWRRTGGPKGDLHQEMDSVVQVPGWTNIWTQPIDNRINMLATGVKSQIGVKVFGPDSTTIDRRGQGGRAGDQGDATCRRARRPGRGGRSRSWARATWRSRSTGRRRPATASASATFRIRLRWHWAAG